jgi:hypothetical protein
MPFHGPLITPDYSTAHFCRVEMGAEKGCTSIGDELFFKGFKLLPTKSAAWLSGDPQC